MNNYLTELKKNFPSSIVVFLVAIPLCLGIALASGAPLFSGLIAGAIGGLVVGSISKSQIGVSGPAAGLAVIVLGAIQTLGFEAFLLAVVMAGLIQIVLGFLRAGIIGYYFPSSVIKGMLTGIGVTIFLTQVPHAFGYDKNPEGETRFLHDNGHNTLSELYFMLEAVHPGAVIITLISLAILLLWDCPFIKRIKGLGQVPGPLVVVLSGIGLKLLFNSIEGLSLGASHLVSVPVMERFSNFTSLFFLPDFSQIGNPQVYIAAFTIGIVASLETLLSVEAADKLDPLKRITPTNRELIAQGTGNMLSGLIGGLPVTQVVVRTTANVSSGGRSKISATLHGLWIIIAALLIPNALNLIPLAALAAILLQLGFKLAKPQVFKSMFKLGKVHFIPFMVTVLVMLFTDLLKGVGTGLVVAVFFILWENYKYPYFFDRKKYLIGKKIKLELSEVVTFFNKASILKALNNLPDGTHVMLDASKSTYIDQDVIEVVEDFKKNAVQRNIKLELIGWSKERLDHPEKQLMNVLDDENQSKENHKSNTKGNQTSKRYA
ncbi:SulP family inorganic anion transporter [Xanthovirga aplysinae]|uniref:SulP family inorganic anion transporter n=1 Tax=Xanthovirga aplysinae TaxID=2529853 RepID=UPI0012BD3EB2|nr:SulP family inorganic anion transporter [Xanthovirga aplysinae]MTI32944.1 SulP family inorganic anion transporter [Xanthovirga aplysinae]